MDSCDAISSESCPVDDDRNGIMDDAIDDEDDGTEQ